MGIPPINHFFFQSSRIQSRSQSPRYPCPGNKNVAKPTFDSHQKWLAPALIRSHKVMYDCVKLLRLALLLFSNCRGSLIDFAGCGIWLFWLWYSGLLKTGAGSEKWYNYDWKRDFLFIFMGLECGIHGKGNGGGYGTSILTRPHK